MKIGIVILFLFAAQFLQAQNAKTPAAFLGYELGSKFTWHYNLVAYAKHLASTMPVACKWQTYGNTNEGRELGVLIVSSAQNMANIETIRQQNIDITNGKAVVSGAPVIVWLSYNVHGNEPSSSEAFLNTAHTLLAAEDAKIKTLLKDAVVILDPCLNPDGRDRYVNWYTSVVGVNPNVNSASREHAEPWPSGRANHYYFDLNRDWAWQTQIESKTRVALYQKWMPHVHSDYHEQGFNEPYYFAPAAEPMHEVITPWQKELQTKIGKNNAKYFDENGWLYFTKELFDLFYPAYGDTWPTYNGSVGMTFEQGGIRAGLGIITEDSDTLTLKDRILHHTTTSISTIEVAVAEKTKTLNAFSDYFKKALAGGSNEFKNYVILNDGSGRIDALEKLLTQNNILYNYTSNVAANGLNYFTNKIENFNAPEGSIFINAMQPSSNLLKVLFERTSKLNDSLTYDITSWCIPFVYGVKTYGTNTIISKWNGVIKEKDFYSFNTNNTYAVVIPYKGMHIAKVVAQLLQANIKVRFSEKDFVYENKKFEKGTIIVTKAANNKDVFKKLAAILTAQKVSIDYTSVTSGFVEKGLDFGSSTVHVIQTPQVLLLTGKNTSSLAVGEIWHYFDKDLQYPITLINTEDLRSNSLKNFNTLILAEGDYEFISKNSFVKDWVNAGGKIIAMEGVVSQLAAAEWGGLKNKESKKEEDKKEADYSLIKVYENRERDDAVNNNPGSVYKLDLDNTHPLAFGYPNYYYTLKQDAKVYDYLKGGWNIGYLKKDNYISGFVGSKTKQAIKDGTIIGATYEGRGNIIFFADNILFRNFWENGKLFMANALFFAGQ